jgi:UDP-glucose 4-epimerase
MYKASDNSAISTQELRGQKILITGASGFIGSHLRRRLCNNGNEVHGTSRRTPPNDGQGLRWWQGDLAQIETTREILKAAKPDVIFHLASQVLAARGMENVLPTFHSNLTTTVNILSAAAEMGCRRVILSNSLEECDGKEPVPSSPYAAAKWASGGYARMFHALYQLPVVILRMFMVYGPAQQDLKKLIPYVTLSLLRGEAPKLTSGLREIDWIYVDDVVDALVTAACAPGIEGRTIDVGSGKLVSIRAIVEHLVQLSNPQLEPAFGAVSDRPLEQVRVADTAESYARLGWTPKTSLTDGLERTVRWYREQVLSAGNGAKSLDPHPTRQPPG